MTTGLAAQVERPHADMARQQRVGSLQLCCPACRREMGAVDLTQISARVACSTCGFTLCAEAGIWQTLPPGREERFRQFMRDYEAVRAQEGRGSSSSEYYLALPYTDITGRNAWQWAIRGRSFVCIEKTLLPRIERRCQQSLDVLDIGAGNCWMSFRLALRGHHPVALDLLTNDQDGLGAAQHYFPRLPQPFPRFQAEMDRLPFGAAQFDVAIFNAAFHYSEDYQHTLREALRCLRPGGDVLIVDSPFYHRDESGRQMVEEKHLQFEKRFGSRCDSIRSREYLTMEILQGLEAACALSWTIIKPWYGLAWTLRPWKASIQRRREPSKFYILWGRVRQP